MSPKIPSACSSPAHPAGLLDCASGCCFKARHLRLQIRLSILYNERLFAFGAAPFA